MKAVILDYSGEYYSALGTPAPDKLSGKFVQLRNNMTEYLIFSSKEFTPYHSDIIERFSAEKGIDGEHDKTNKRFNIHDPDWVVMGGGKFELDRREKHIRLYDDSMAYGKFEPEGLKERLLKTEEFSGHKVVIE